MSRRTKPSRPKPPDDLSEEATLEFQRLVDVLEDEGRLAEADVGIIVLLAEAWATYRASMRRVSKDGATFTHANGQTGPTAHVRIAKEYSRICRGLLRDLMLTPASRAKVAGELEDALPEF